MSTIDTASSASAAGATGTLAGTTSKAKTDNDLEGADRFLKLLVAQMKNQDPLNPLDNAEVTTQMAQISTVSGIEKMNRSIEQMLGSFNQNQAMQATGLIGREVVLEGSGLRLDAEGKGGGAFQLAGAADKVTVDILASSGAVLDTIELGALGAGTHSFDWTLKQGVAASQVDGFRVNAQLGKTAVVASPYMRDRVEAVLTGGSQLNLELAGGVTVPYGQVKAFR